MTLAHDIAGDGDPVVLLHSSVCDRRMWDPLLPYLRDGGYRTLRADFRGHGETPTPTEPYNNADDVRELLDAQGIERVSLVGSSFGGKVATEFAARWPERVDRLVVACAPPVVEVPETEAITAFSDREDELLEAGDVEAATELNVATWLGPAADAATRDFVRTMQRHTFEVQLAAEDTWVQATDVDFGVEDITATTLVMTGRHDMDYMREGGRALAGRIPGARHVEPAWAGHLPSLERPETFSRLLREALGRR